MMFSMTFHESYGELPKRVLTLIRRYNISPADYDQILNAFGYVYGDSDIDWTSVVTYIEAATVSGIYRPSMYL